MLHPISHECGLPRPVSCIGNVMFIDRQGLQSFAISALGVKKKVTSLRDILSLAYAWSGVVGHLFKVLLPRKSYQANGQAGSTAGGWVCAIRRRSSQAHSTNRQSVPVAVSHATSKSHQNSRMTTPLRKTSSRIKEVLGGRTKGYLDT